MNLDLSDMTTWFDNFKKEIPTLPEESTIIIAASAPYLGILSVLTKNKNLRLASQDASALEKGAHTGEIGAFQLADFCTHSIIGHTERKETLDISIKKSDQCLNNGLTPIFCFSKIDDVKAIYKEGIILAWEDPSNISKNGKYNEKPIEEIQKGIDKIREQIPEEAILIYGGSVNRQNIDDLATVEGLDGILPGNASIDPIHFAELVIKFSNRAS
jgi:triosephosphate isomerase